MLTKSKLGVVKCLFAKTKSKRMIRQEVEKAFSNPKEKDYQIEIFTLERGKNGVLNPRTPHLSDHPTSDSVGHHTIHLRRSRNPGPSPCRIQGGMKLV